MPAILSDELLSDWLGPETTGDRLLPDAVSEMSLPISEQLREYAVRPRRGDRLAMIEPA